MSDNIFLTASRLKLRFASPLGLLNVEDLWEIPLTSVSSKKPSIEAIGALLLARQAELEKVQGASILGANEPSPELAEVNLQVNILRTVAQMRQAEAKAKTQAAALRSEKARLDALIQEREGKEMPLDKLKEQRAALDAASAAEAK